MARRDEHPGGRPMWPWDGAIRAIVGEKPMPKRKDTLARRTAWRGTIAFQRGMADGLTWRKLYPRAAPPGDGAWVRAHMLFPGRSKRRMRQKNHYVDGFNEGTGAVAPPSVLVSEQK